MPEVQQAHLVQKDMEEMKKAAPTVWVPFLCVGLRFAMLRIASYESVFRKAYFTRNALGVTPKRRRKAWQSAAASEKPQASATVDSGSFCRNSRQAASKRSSVR